MPTDRSTTGTTAHKGRLGEDVPIPGLEDISEGHAVWRDKRNLIVRHSVACAEGERYGQHDWRQTYFSQGRYVLWELETNCRLKLRPAQRALIHDLKR